MAENANISEKCMYLARKVVGLGTAINRQKKRADTLFAALRSNKRPRCGAQRN